MAEGRGRPARRGNGDAQGEGSRDARQKLIEAAQKLFLEHDFDRVTIRKIADMAGVNSAMISYYFGDKEGLFTSAIDAYFAPVKDKMIQDRKLGAMKDPTEIVGFFFDRIPPELPMLLLKLSFSKNQASLLDKILTELFLPTASMIEQTINHMKSHGQIDHDVDPSHVRLLMHSLLVGPMAMKNILAPSFSKPMDQQFFKELTGFYSKILYDGVFKRPLGQSDRNYENIENEAKENKPTTLSRQGVDHD